MNWYETANFYRLPHVSMFDHMGGWLNEDRFQVWRRNFNLHEKILHFFWQMFPDGLHAQKDGHRFYSQHVNQELEVHTTADEVTAATATVLTNPHHASSIGGLTSVHVVDRITVLHD
jgi:hypothetical protein